MRNVLLQLVALWCGLPASAGAPVVGQTPDPAIGGCQMIVAGEGFVAGRTRFRLWSPEWRVPVAGNGRDFPEKDETQRLLAYLGQSEPPLPEKPGTAFVDCQVIRCTNSLAAVEFPQYGPWSGPRTGSYFAILYAGDERDGWSRPWAFNRTEAHMLDRDAAAPGDFVRIFGRKLQAMHAPLPIIALVPKAGGKPLACPTQDIYYQHQHYIANYSCQFRLPADVPEGSYLVRAHNHTGEAWGWSEPLPLVVRKTGQEPKLIRAATLDQKILDEAGKSAPAVVALPPGTFNLTETLAVPPGITLRGSGMLNTLLCASKSPPFRPGKKEPITRALLWGRTDFAIEDLAVRGAGGSGGALLILANDRGGMSENVAVRRCRLEAAEGWQGIFASRARRFSLDHCELSSVALWAWELKQCYFGFNRVENLPHLAGGSLGLGPGSTNVVVEHNTFIGQGLAGPGGARNLLVAGNSAEKAPGPAFAARGAAVRWRGPATCPDPGSVVTPGKAWRLAPEAHDRDLTGCVVAVVAGKGIGQWRDVAGANADTIRLAAPFAVQPDNSSELCVLRASVANTFVCNMAFECAGAAGGFLDAGSINGVIEGVQAVSAGAPCVQSGHAPGFFNSIAHCRLFSCAGIQLAARSGGALHLGSVAARNEVLRLRPRQPTEAPVGRPRAAVVVDGPLRFSAIEGNRIADCDAAVEVGAHPLGTLVRRNRMVGIQRGPIIDQGIESMVAGFTDKAGFHDHWPQGLNVLQLFGGTLPEPEEKK